MKTIFYISQSVERPDVSGLPKSVPQILVRGRRKNKNANITAFFCFYEGYYLQVIEGDNRAVDELFEKIKLDDRHKNIRRIVEKAISRRMFEAFPLKLGDSSLNDDAFMQYIEVNIGLKLSSFQSVAQIFQSLLNVENTSSGGREGFDGCSINLKLWPRFDKISPTRELLELCAMMNDRAISYDFILSENPFSTLDELNRYLRILDDMALLDIKFIEKQSEKVIKKGRFFNKLRGFIGRVTMA